MAEHDDELEWLDTDEGLFDDGSDNWEPDDDTDDPMDELEGGLWTTPFADDIDDDEDDPESESHDGPEGATGLVWPLLALCIVVGILFLALPRVTFGQARVSWYWPPLGGTNCSQFTSAGCVSNMASGDPWQDWVGWHAMACSPEFSLGSLVILKVNSVWQVWICKDRGGAIQHVSAGTYWVDMLTERPLVPFGTDVEAIFIDV